jgi:hypothetical protein
MSSRGIAAPLLALLLIACSGSTHVLRVESERAQPVVHVPRGDRAAVEVDEDTFAGAFLPLVLSAPPSSQPLQEARRLFWASPRSDAYAGTRRHLGLVSRGTHEEAPRAHLLADSARRDAEITSGYGQWCTSGGKPRDCLHLMEGGPTLGPDSMRALAMHFAMASVWEETKGALGEMVDPVAIQATLVSAMTMYLMLWVLPEPLSKGVAAAMTVALIGYLGIDTVWSLIQGWTQLVEQVDKAASFEQVRASGQRFGKVMGRNSARIFVLLATTAVGNTTAGFASKLPALPGASQAAMVAEAQGGVRLSLAAAVDTVTVSAEGATLVLAPGAMAMASQGEGDGNGPTGDTSVYISKAPNQQVQYAGITNSMARRAAEQLRQRGLRIQELMSGLSREDARSVEQALIELHGLQKRGGTLLNRINSVARSNPKYADMLRRGKELLESIGYEDGL